ncbi:unnamed protein product [Echinostoma caproni]|uniref:DHC_N1 domain-containing protein n=1 Tax=Echinostoma caproni TaxID=27848 RepID=A0A183AU41_9TREM|nr:unnamed protein product [Echinostoma caproni]
MMHFSRKAIRIKEREARRAELDGRFGLVFEKVADFFRVEKNFVEESVLSKNQEITFIGMDFSRGVLHSLEDLMTTLIAPQLSNVPDKMLTAKSACEEFNKQELMDQIENFVGILCNSSEILENQVILKPCSERLLSGLKSLPEDRSIVPSPSLLVDAEACVSVWIGQLEQVLGISDQIRKESDDTGPRVELDYWRRRMATFHSLVHQMQNPLHKSLLAVLQLHKSKLIKVGVKMVCFFYTDLRTKHQIFGH